MACAGDSSAICGSFAVLPISASIETTMPGAMATPRYSPAAEMAIKTVAVPKLTTISGAPKRSRPPMAAATRSAPTSAGCLGHDANQALRLRFEKSRPHVEETFAGRLEHRVELWNDARNRYRVDLLDADVARRKELRKKDAVLVGCTPQFGRHAPRALQLTVLETAELRFGVARRRSSGACHQLLDRIEQARGEIFFAGGSQIAARVVAPQQGQRVLSGAEAALAAHVVDRDRIEMLSPKLLRVLAPRARRSRPRTRPKRSSPCARRARRARRDCGTNSTLMPSPVLCSFDAECSAGRQSATAAAAMTRSAPTARASAASCSSCAVVTRTISTPAGGSSSVGPEQQRDAARRA